MTGTVIDPTLRGAMSTEVRKVTVRMHDQRGSSA